MKQTDGKSPAPNADEHAGTWEQFRSSWAIKVRKEERRNKERKVKGRTSKAAAPKAATLQSTLRQLKSVCTVILTCDAIGEVEMATLESAISEVQAARTNTIAVKRH